MSRIFLVLTIVVSLMSCAKQNTDFSALKGNQKKDKTLLSTGWMLQQRPKAFDGLVFSKNAFITNDSCTQVTVPSTVLGALVEAGVYKDVYTGFELAKIDKKQFESSWIYSKEFSLDERKEQTVTLDLDGINYYANVWLNGVLIADTSQLFGVYKQYELDITDAVKTENHLVIEIFPPVPGDFTIGFVDWAPVPADLNMGLWREVSYVVNNQVGLTETFVYADFDVDNPTEADLFISGTLKNHTDNPQNVTLKGTVNGQEFTSVVKLQANEVKQLNFDVHEFPQLKVKNPNLWWPHNYGEPHLYEFKWEASVDGHVSARQAVTFGVRKVEDYVNKDGHRGYKINGKEILVKGAGWVDDLLLNNTRDFDESQIKYAKAMHLNTIRFEGFWGKNEDLYSLCDKHGMLAMVGFSCQWEWSDYLGGKKFDESEAGFGGVVEPQEIDLVADYFEAQVKWLRNHPSIFVYTVGSDRLPHPDLELKERAILARCDPSRPMLTAAKYMVSKHSGPSGVKMEGPYDYVTPNYWYTDTVRGGAFGFNTETGPGPQPPVMYSINKMIPVKAEQWPLDNGMWSYHSGRHAFGDMSKFLKAFDARYGASDNVEDFAKFAQVATYEAMRPMFEAFAVDRPNTTGIIQWMLNSAWPETYWQLYDSYLHPNGAFYGAMHGARDLNVIYNYDDENIYVSNETLSAFDGSVVVRVFTKESKEVVFETVPIKKLKGPRLAVELGSKIKKSELENYFIDVRLLNSKNEEVADNFYWLSNQPDVIDPVYDNSSWIYTPNLSFTDLQFVRSLPTVELEVSDKKVGDSLELTITNNSDYISFFNEFTIVKNGDPVLPVFWSDNYVSLLPGESKILTVSVNEQLGDALQIELNGINSVVK